MDLLTDFDKIPISKYANCNNYTLNPDIIRIKVKSLKRGRMLWLPKTAKIGHAIAVAFYRYMIDSYECSCVARITHYEIHHGVGPCRYDSYTGDICKPLRTFGECTIKFFARGVDLENMSLVKKFCETHDNCQELLQYFKETTTLKGTTTTTIPTDVLAFAPEVVTIANEASTNIIKASLFNLTQLIEPNINTQLNKLFADLSLDRARLLLVYQKVIVYNSLVDGVVSSGGLITILEYLYKLVRANDNLVNPHMMDCYNVKPTSKLIKAFLQEKYEQDIGMSNCDHEFFDYYHLQDKKASIDGVDGVFRRDNLDALITLLTNIVGLAPKESDLQFHCLLMRNDVQCLINNGDLCRHLKEINHIDLIRALTDLLGVTTENKFLSQLENI